MSVAEQVFAQAQALPEPAQKTVLAAVKQLAKQNPIPKPPAPKAGSAKGRIHLAPDFAKPLEDFKPDME